MLLLWRKTVISGEKTRFLWGKERKVGENGIQFVRRGIIFRLPFFLFYFPRLNCTGGETGSVSSSVRGNQWSGQLTISFPLSAPHPNPVLFLSVCQEIFSNLLLFSLSSQLKLAHTPPALTETDRADGAVSHGWGWNGRKEGRPEIWHI